MNRSWSRPVMIVVGVTMILTYTAASLGGLVIWQWILAHPPSPGTLLVSLLGGVLLAGYAGYRLGTTQLIAQLDATKLSPRQIPRLSRRLQRLCEKMTVTEPPVLVADLGAPNALSLGGPRRGAIVLDSALFQLLTVEELEGILAHELAHIENRDTFVQTLIVTAVRTVVGTVSMLLFPLVVFLIGIDRGSAWIAGQPGEWRYGLTGSFQRGLQFCLGGVLSVLTLGVFAYSRRREYAADRRAATVTGNPVALARALVKIHRASEPSRGILDLLYIQREKRDETGSVLSTHPPLEKRVDRLLELTDRPVRPESVW